MSGRSLSLWTSCYLSWEMPLGVQSIAKVDIQVLLDPFSLFSQPLIHLLAKGEKVLDASPERHSWRSALCSKRPAGPGEMRQEESRKNPVATIRRSFLANRIATQGGHVASHSRCSISHSYRALCSVEDVD